MGRTEQDLQARRAQRAADVRRRRLVALGGLLATLLLVIVALGLGGSDDANQAAKAEPPPPPPELPRGGRRILPDNRVVAFYGAPQDKALGALGIGKPDKAVSKLIKQAEPYDRKTRPVLPALELISSIATAAPGADGLYRSHQTDAVIKRYLKAARKRKALLILDIQPGRDDFLAEAERLEKWLTEPDVSLALDPEWHVAAPGLPGKVIGSVDAREVNAVSAWLSQLVRRKRLPQKLLVIHKFTNDMIANEQRVKRRPGLAVTMNIDGFGTRAAKESKYRDFTTPRRPFFNGFKLFYEEDTETMSPRQTMALRPRPDLIVYE